MVMMDAAMSCLLENQASILSLYEQMPLLLLKKSGSLSVINIQNSLRTTAQDQMNVEKSLNSFIF